MKTQDKQIEVALPVVVLVLAPVCVEVDEGGMEGSGTPPITLIFPENE
jgi:hypothetical protein